MNYKCKIALCLSLLVMSLAVKAQDIPARPNPPRLVNDFAHVLSPGEVDRLEQKLVAYDDTTSNQIAVVTVHTLNGYPIEDYALKILRDWGVGNKQTNNGIVILAAIDDRKVYIATGYGLEGAIPDITAGHIVQNDIVPNFRSGDYFDGFDQAASSLIKAAAGEYKAPAGYRGKRSPGGGIGAFALFIIIIIIIAIIRRRGGGGGGGGFMSRRGYSNWIAPFILGEMLGSSRGGGGWGGGGGWSGGGGGGFGGFGGGSGGGGGAGGSW